MVLTQ